jgi:ADP-heptose:LPS heptosyltransferase
MKKKYLLIRRDNIGDLVCTTPLLDLILQADPNSQVEVLVNSYNAAVVQYHPHIHRVHIYTKAKHRHTGLSLLSIYWQRFKQLMQLRQEDYDIVFFCQRTEASRVYRLAKWLKPKNIVYFADTAKHTASEIILAVSDYLDQHEAQVVAAMATALGINDQKIPPCSVYPSLTLQQRAQVLLKQQAWYQPHRKTVAMHISARKPSQRWPAEKFIALMHELAQQYELQFILFWSPGSINNALHPGDDEKAQAIIKGTANLPILPFATDRLELLIAGLSICDEMICSDGGAMHIGAGLSKPIVCLFGKSNPILWHPWGVPYQLLQAPSQQVEDITVNEVSSAFAHLQQIIAR